MTPPSIASFLPGLWLALVAGLLTAVLHRFYDRLPPLAPAVFAAVVAFAFGPVLFGGRLLLPLDNLRGYPPFEHLEATEPHGNPVQGDLILLIAPSDLEVRRALGKGRWPLWNPRVGAGMPLLADPQSQAASPLAMAGRALPFAAAPGMVAGLRVYCALLFTFLFLRRQGMDQGPAIAGALAYGLGGFLMLWVGWPLASTAALLPAVLYGVARGTDPGGRRDLLLLTGAVWALLLAGHPETIAYSLVLAAAFAWARLSGDDRQKQRSGPSRRKATRMALAAGLALGAAAPVLLPTAAYLPHTLRAARIADPPPSFDPDAASRAAQRLLPVAAPNAFGNSRYAHYWGWSNTNEDASGFVGSAALLLALLAVGTRRRRRLPQEGLMLAAAGFCLLILALPPGLPQLLRRLPGGTLSDYHHRLLLPLSFCLAYLAAAELHRRCRGDGRWWTPPLAAAALGGLVAWAYLAHSHPEAPETLAVLRDGWLRWHLRFFSGAALLLAVAPWLARRAGEGSREAAGAPRGEGRPGAGAGDEDGMTVPVATLRGRREGGSTGGDEGGEEGEGDDGDSRGPGATVLDLLAQGRPLVPYLLAAAVAAELLLAHLPANPPMPRRLAIPEPPPLAFLRDHLEPGARAVGLGRTLPPNLASLHGLADPRIYNPMAPRQYIEATSPLSAGWSGEVPRFGNPAHPLDDLLAVRYFLAPAGETLPPPLTPVLRHPSAWVWERPHPLPLLFLPAAARTVEAPVLDHLAMVGDFAAEALVPAGAPGPPPVRVSSPESATRGPEEAAGVQPPDGDAFSGPESAAAMPASASPGLSGPGSGTLWRAGSPAADKLNLMALQAARIRAGSSAPEPRLLATSLYQDGGWRLLLDGRRHSTFRADGPYLAAWLPPGDHRLTLLYRPLSLLLGGLLAALALATTAVWLLPIPARSATWQLRATDVGSPHPAPRSCEEG